MGGDHRSRIRPGDDVYVIVVTARGKRRDYLVKAQRGRSYATIAGVLGGDEIIGREWGVILELQAGKAFILPPTRYELSMMGFRRLGQVIYPKDYGYMVAVSGIRQGMTVLEAGVGSGFLTSMLASIIGCSGRLIGYDIREDMIETTRRNLKALGLEECVELRLGDVRKGVPEKGIDAVFLDMPDPWQALNPIHESLKPGAPVVVFLPTYNQLDKLVSYVNSSGGYVIEEAVELLLRGIDMKEGAIRPETRMIGHTGFVVLLRMVRGNL